MMARRVCKITSRQERGYNYINSIVNKRRLAPRSSRGLEWSSRTVGFQKARICNVPNNLYRWERAPLVSNLPMSCIVW